MALTLQNGQMNLAVLNAMLTTLAFGLDEYQERYVQRNEAMAQAYQSGAYTMAQIAEHFGVHYMAVSGVVRALEGK